MLCGSLLITSQSTSDFTASGSFSSTTIIASTPTREESRVLTASAFASGLSAVAMAGSIASNAAIAFDNKLLAAASKSLAASLSVSASVLAFATAWSF